MAADSPDDAHVDDSLVQYLSERDVPCPGCKYNLRGLKLDVCPECGLKFSLGLHGHRYNFRDWLAIIMTCIGMSISLLFTAGGYIALVLGDLKEWFQIIFLGLFMIHVVAGWAFLTMLERRKDRSWQYSQCELAMHMVGGFLLFLVPIGLFFLYAQYLVK